VVDWSGNRASMVECGVVRARGDVMAERLHQIYIGLEEVVKRYEPTVIAVEQPFLGKNPATTMAIGMARTLALLLAAQHGTPCVEYTPAMVKKAVVGRGAASKQQVAAMVQVILGLTELPRPDDATDALAIALTHTHRVRIVGIEQRAGPRSRSRGGARRR